MSDFVDEGIDERFIEVAVALLHGQINFCKDGLKSASGKRIQDSDFECWRRRKGRMSKHFVRCGYHKMPKARANF